MQPWPCYVDQLRTIPYMDAMHAEWLREYAEDAASILEWGCGGSTIWLAQIAKGTLVTIEHDERWFEKIDAIRKALSGLGIGLCLADFNLRPDHNRYCDQEGQYDLAFIDGKAEWRLDCLAACVKCVKPGGHIFMHDSQRYPSQLFPFVTEHCQKSEQRIDSIGVGMWHGQLKG
ncbi:hypothetical protein LCGC14_2199430 [marine sediment metagenome]|uniref:Methyltransferase domain-containing protein n=1 Tax=marine sediment metagenome TaxID=412755 RepID=A0A0F9GCX0_9ZZZZ